MNGHNHALVRPSPRAQGRPGGQRTLGVNDAVTDLGEASAQRLAEEHLMPVPVPGDASGSAAPLQSEAEAEDGYGERPAPREWRDERGSYPALKIPPKLLDMRVNARGAFLPEDGRDDQRQGSLILDSSTAWARRSRHSL